MGRSLWCIAIPFLAALVGAGCADAESKAPRTALVVEVHTDLEVGDEIDEVRVFASSAADEGGAGNTGMGSKGSLDDGELPVNVVLEPAAGVTSVRVVAEGYLDGDRVRSQTRRTEFVANEVRVLRMELSSVCAMECPDEGDTCVDRGGIASCEPEYIDPRYLLRPGEPPDAGVGPDAAVDAGRDADVEDSGTCTAELETCNGADDDCDKRVDEGATICPQNEPFAISACDEDNGATRCRVIACRTGRLDCDDDPDCETQISAEHCGECAMACELGDVCAQAAGSGSGYECLDSNQCPGTTEVCAATCVDKQTSALHCGECDTECAQLPNASPSCAGGACELDCAEGYASCNGEAPGTDGFDDGCETDILIDPMHCGGCEGTNTMCPSRTNSETFCDDGICAFRCMDGFLNCNETMSDGCETSIGKDDCYACGNACNGLLEQCCANQRDCCVL